MTNYVKAIFKLANNQLNKLKSAAKDKAGTTLRIKKEKLSRRRISSWIIIRNFFDNNSLTDMQLEKAHFSKIIQSGGCLGNMRSKLGKNPCWNLMLLWLKIFCYNEHLEQLCIS